MIVRLLWVAEHPYATDGVLDLLPAYCMSVSAQSPRGSHSSGSRSSGRGSMRKTKSASSLWQRSPNGAQNDGAAAAAPLPRTSSFIALCGRDPGA